MLCSPSCSSQEDVQIVDLDADSLLNSEGTEQFDPEKCLVMNEILQVLVQNKISHINKEIKAIYSRKAYLKHLTAVNDVDHSKKSKNRPQIHEKVKSLSRQRPFFRTSSGFMPPLNEDQRDRMNRNEFNVYDVKRTVWKQWSYMERQKLIHSVGVQMRNIRKTSLDSREAALEVGLKRVALDTEEGVSVAKRSEQLCADIRQVHKERDVLASLTHVQLAALCTDKTDIDSIDWNIIASRELSNTVTEANARLAWMHFISPSLNVQQWTREEDSLLQSAVERLGCHAWEAVAKEVKKGRTPFMCLQRWQRNHNPQHLVNRAWSDDEDAYLIQVVIHMLDSNFSNGVIRWPTVAAHMEARTTSECIQRWHKINPNLRTCDFTDHEDLQLLLAIQRHGPFNWNLITASLPGRTPQSIRQRYHEIMEPFHTWSPADDRRLCSLMAKISSDTNMISIKFWRQLMPYFQGRSIGSIRRRWKTLRERKVAWNRLRMAAVETEPVDEIKPSTWNKNLVTRVLLRTPLISDLVTRLKSTNNVANINTLIDMICGDNKDWVEDEELQTIISEARQGIIVPRSLRPDQAPDYQFERDTAFFNRITEHKRILEPSIRDELIHTMSHEAASANFSSTRIDSIRSLLSNESEFWVTFDSAIHRPKLFTKFSRFRLLSAIRTMIPDIADEMIAIKLKTLQTPKSNPQAPKVGAKRRSLVSLHAPHLKIMRMHEIFRLVRSVRNVRTLPKRPRKLAHVDYYGQICRHLPQDTQDFLQQSKIIDYNTNKVAQIFSQGLEVETGNENNNEPELPTLPPTYATILGFKTLLLERKKLASLGGDFVSMLFHTAHKMNEIIDVAPSKCFINAEDADTIQCYRPRLQAAIHNPAFEHLKSRFFSLFVWPAIISTLNLSSIETQADALSEKFALDSKERHNDAKVPKKEMSKAHAEWLRRKRHEYARGSHITGIRGSGVGTTVSSLKRKRLYCKAKTSNEVDVASPDKKIGNDDSPVEESVEPPKKRHRVDVPVCSRPSRSAKTKAAAALHSFIVGENEMESRKEDTSGEEVIRCPLTSGVVVLLPRRMLDFVASGFHPTSFISVTTTGCQTTLIEPPSEPQTMLLCSKEEPM